MKRSMDVCALLVCFSVLMAAVSYSHVEADVSPCGFTLELPSDAQSLTIDNGNIHNQSLTPWRWRWSMVNNRIPSILWEAECTSSECSGPFSGYHGRQHLNSVPVYQTVLVLTRQEDGLCYVASYQSVVVGCTCVSARVDQN